MRNTKFICTLILTMTAIRSACALTSGTCGDDCTFVMEGGTLTISGTGKVDSKDSWDIKVGSWQDFESNSDNGVYESLVINEGITSFDYDAIYGFSCKNITIPESVIYLGSELEDQYYVENLTIPARLLDGRYVTTGMDDIYVDNKADLIEKYETGEIDKLFYDAGMEYYETNDENDIFFGGYGNPLAYMETAVIHCIGEIDECRKQLEKGGLKEEDFAGLVQVDSKNQSSHTPKRIYTLDEANAVAGKTNTFSIRYR